MSPALGRQRCRSRWSSWLLLAAPWLLLRPAAASGLRASVASSFPGRSSAGFPSAPAIFSFETSDQDFYELFQLELRVIFLPSPHHGPVAALRGAPIQGCDELLVEVSDGFPSPLNCYSGDFSGNSTAEQFFSIRFGPDRTLRRSSSYSFVVPGLQLLLGGPLAGGRENFAWRVEFRMASGSLMENATAMLEHDVHDQLPDAHITEFLVEGGKDMSPGSQRQLRLSFRLASFPANGELLVTFLPLLLWDQTGPDCELALGPMVGNCTYQQSASGAGYNQLLIQPEGSLPLHSESVFYVSVVAPSGHGVLPTEITAAVLVDRGLHGMAAHGPFFEGSGSSAPPPIEMYVRFVPSATVAFVSNRLEGAPDSAVTLRLRPGAALRGRDLRGQERQVFLAVTTSAFFRIVSAATAASAAPLGTDHAPLLKISADGRTAALHFGGLHALALGNVEYSVQLIVEFPLRYFWAVGGSDPWTVSVEQGPRQGCSGCPSIHYEGSFDGPPVDFAIRKFQVLPSSLLLGAQSEVVFSFQLIYAAEQFVLVMPEGYSPQSCAFQGPISLEGRKRAFLRCVPQTGTFLVTSQPPDRPLEPLPASQPLVFKGAVLNPLASGDQLDDTELGSWSASALDAAGTTVARTRREDEVQLLLFARQLPFFTVRADDQSPNATAVVTVSFVVGMGLRPGDSLRVTAPAGYHWRFLASEFSPRPSGLNLEEPLPVDMPSAEGLERHLVLRVASILLAYRFYGFSARVEHPAERPADYHWSLETFGPSAVFAASQRYEASSLEGYKLSQILDVGLWPWTQARSTAGPLTLTFATTQAVRASGILAVQSPAGFDFTSRCNVSELRLDEGPDASAVTLPAASIQCEAVTPNEIHIGLSAAGTEGGLRDLFLEAGSRYALTLHSLANPVGTAFMTGTTERWRVETKDAAQQTLDAAPPIEAFLSGAGLPYAELLAGGPSTGEDLTAGGLQWVTIAFKVAVPTEPKQRMTVFAPPSSIFEAFCAVRDPPAHVTLFANPAGQQISDCRGLGASAEMQIEAVWELRRTYAFQVQVRNALPSSKPVPPLEAPFRAAWRLCLDTCRQSGELRSPPRPLGFEALELVVTSRVFGERATLLIQFMLSTSIPPRGVLTVRAPDGYAFPVPCAALTSEGGEGHSGLPPGTVCRSGAEVVLGSSRTSRPSQLQLMLGPTEGHRLVAHKPYAFSVGVNNPSVDNVGNSFVWEVSTAVADGKLLDYMRTDQSEPVLGPLLLPLLGWPAMPGSPNAGHLHTVLLSFRVLTTEEGGDSSLVPFMTRLEIRSPVDRGRSVAGGVVGDVQETSEWDLTDPAVCSAPFVGRDGLLSNGVQHYNLTAPDGDVACLPDGRHAFSLTFRPSLMTPRVVTTLEFFVRNPLISPGPSWNRWRLRVARVQPRLAEDAVDREVSFLAAQRVLFTALCEANIEGFTVIPAFLEVRLSPSSYAVNASSNIGFELQSRLDIHAGAVLVVSAPVGFVAPSGASAVADFTSDSGGQTPDGLELLPAQPGAPVNEAHVRFTVGHPRSAGPIRFTLQMTNPPVPTSFLPFWDFQLRESQAAGAAMLERSVGHPGYFVYLPIKVAGLYGSVREIGSKYNFVRITFSLPVPLPGGGVVAVVAPSGYTLLPDGFSRENMPPLTGLILASADEVGYNPQALNVSVPNGLRADQYYAFRFGVENPGDQLHSDRRPWQLWCRAPSRAVVAANLDVNAFRLEARFQAAALLPSTVLPLRGPNLVELQLALGSSPLELLRGPFHSDRAFLELRLPAAFRLAGDIGRSLGCHLQVGVLGRTEDASAVPGQVLMPLPSSSVCSAVSPQHLIIEVFETLPLGLAYHFVLELENPLEAAEVSSWTISTQRNGALLHLAVEVANFALAASPSFHLAASDITRSASQLLHVELRPRRHVRGRSAIELVPPQGFNLSCGQTNASALFGLLPQDTNCTLRGEALRLDLAPPPAYAPYMPSLLAGQRYAFAAPCANPPDSLRASFQLRLVEEWPVPSQVLELKADLEAPALAAPLDLLELSTEQEVKKGESVQLTVRFRAPVGSMAAGPVRAVLLEGPAGTRLSRAPSSPCEGFASRVLQAGDVALPESVCSGASTSGVLIQMPEPLPLEGPGAGGIGLTYVFELSVPALVSQPLVDSFLLALLPGPGGAPRYSGSAPGFSGKVDGLQPQALPPVPGLYNATPPRDSSRPPLSTVRTEASRARGPRPGSLSAVHCLVAAAVACAA